MWNSIGVDQPNPVISPGQLNSRGQSEYSAANHQEIKHFRFHIISPQLNQNRNFIIYYFNNPGILMQKVLGHTNFI